MFNVYSGKIALLFENLSWLVAASNGFFVAHTHLLFAHTSTNAQTYVQKNRYTQRTETAECAKQNNNNKKYETETNQQQ